MRSTRVAVNSSQIPRLKPGGTPRFLLAFGGRIVTMRSPAGFVVPERQAIEQADAAIDLRLLQL